MPELLTADVEADETITDPNITAEAVPTDEVLVEDDLLVEDVSIDGMCGVY